MKKKNKGITLVSLVITIIILLILAGITIVQLTKSGLFAKAEEAKEKYKTLAIICEDSLGTIYSNVYPVTLIKEKYGTLYQIVGASKYSNFTIKDSINIENSQIENLWIKCIYGL